MNSIDRSLRDGEEGGPNVAHHRLSRRSVATHIAEPRATPRPWVVWSSLYEGYGASVVHDVEPLKTVAQVRDYADALLIAHAVNCHDDLLAALRKATDALEPHAAPGNACSEALLVGVIAIAKAEGRS